MFKSVLSTKVIRMFTLFILMLLGLSVHGFTKQISSENATQRKQIESSASVKLIEVQDGVRLNIKNGTIIGLSLSEKIKDKVKWQDLIGSKYVIGDIHSTDVTPQLWRKLEVKLTKRDNSIAEITMLRPLWWLQLTKAREGGYLDLSVPEAGLKGTAKVIKISSCCADSRKTKDGHHLVIGKIKHHNAKIISISFVGQKDKLGVTPNHPLYSITHEKWLAAGLLKKGDELKTAASKPAVVKAVYKDNIATVYNLEIHRAKSYFVGTNRILAHNTGIDCDELYEIGDGVRRSKAASEAGLDKIPAVLFENGKTIAKGDVPISQLRSPHKDTISLSGSGLDRWLDTLKRTLKGEVPPPIEITKGSRGVKVKDIKVE